MMELNLNGSWKMKRTDEAGWINAVVPGSVFNDLLNAGKIEDPFFRDNELKAKGIASYDYEYEREFDVDSSLLMQDKVYLKCMGLDTLSNISINGECVACTDNMHREYEFDIKHLLKDGKNVINVVFYSPVKFIEKKHKEYPLWGTTDAMEGFPHIRKAHSMFGWDWGPKIPDSGIWRDISIIGFSEGRLDDVYITQHHGENKVSLDVRVKVNNWSTSKLTIKVTVTGPCGSQTAKRAAVEGCENHINVDIDSPKLWWPNNFGEHPLYNVEVSLEKEDLSLDKKDYRIGLRTLTVRREKDQWGESFEILINGTAIFSMGADYIPEDSLLPRYSRERTERLIQDCVKANFNSIRVWGGGLYPDDYFFDLCDEYGLIVWQDLMFACAVYDMNEEFTENIKKEAEDNIKRIRHHASLGLWCGNNEMEMGWVDWPFPKIPKLRTDYIKQFEIILPEVAKKTDPNTFYWPASPSSGGGFDNPNDPDRGDVHYWDVWHGLKPFSDYRNFYFRYASEFGFQSFPCLKTIETFTLPEDRNIFSYVMEMHQKNVGANGKILYYLSENFKYPKDFSSLLFASQLLQAEAIKYGVEHWRRNRGRCMGSIYWQLNDCWPVASWASIDYFNRWKALHYFAKKFYAPVLVSACEEGTKVEFHVSNESFKGVSGKVIWKLRGNTSKVLKEGIVQADVAPLSTKLCVSLDFADILMSFDMMRKAYVEYSFIVDNKEAGSGTVLFVKAKHFDFLNPEIEVHVAEDKDKFIISVKSKAYAKYVELDLKDMDCVFSDNYFDLSAGDTKTIEIEKSGISKEATLEDIEKQLTVRSVFDIA